MTHEETERMANLTRRLADTAIDYKQRCEELEAKLAQAVEALEYIYDGHSAAGRNPQLMANKAEDALAAIQETPHD